jgi:hypothetical protein
MASEADSSILSPTLPSVDTEKSTESKKKNISLWMHTRSPYEDELKRYRKNEIMYCKYCTEISHGLKSTSNFRQYLDSKHEIIVPAQLGSIRTTTKTQLRKLYIKLRTTNQTIEVNSLAFRNALDKEAITAALISLITVQNLPFRIVEWPEFYVFCRVLNPEINGYITTAHSEVGKMIQNSGWLTISFLSIRSIDR